MGLKINVLIERSTLSETQYFINCITGSNLILIFRNVYLNDHL